MIKVKPRTAVPQEVIDAIKDTTRARLTNLKAELDGYPRDYQRKAFLRNNGLAIARMQRLLKDPTALDMEITRLRGLRFVRYWLEPAHRDEDDDGYFAAETPDVVIEYHGRWNLGQYLVYLPIAAFLKGQVGAFGNAVGFHFIPKRNPLTGERHMHHAGHPTALSSSRRDPLLMNPSTCWGGFGPVIVGNVKDCDVVETFRTIYTYLGRYDASSPLIWNGLNGISHKNQVAI